MILADIGQILAGGFNFVPGPGRSLVSAHYLVYDDILIETLHIIMNK